MELRPFRSIRFSPEVIAKRGLSSLTAPPYDQISSEVQRRLHEAAPENIVRITFRREEEGKDRYAEAWETLRRWLAEGTLEKERRPGLWIYRQTFEEEGKTYIRNALVGLVRLSKYEDGVIHPHEHTLSRPKEDRLLLRKAVRADFGLTFLLTRAPLEAALKTTRRPDLSAVDGDGVRHDAFRVGDFAEHVAFQGLVKNAEAIIADGHHRYETALELSKDPSAEKLPGSKYKLCAIVDMAAPGLIVRAVHRLIRGLPGWDARRLFQAASELFETRPFASAREALETHREASRLRPGFVLFSPPEEPAILLLRDRLSALPWPEGRSEAWRGLDVAALEVALLSRLLSIDPAEVTRGEKISFTSDAQEAIAAVEKGEAQAAILMRPTTVADVERVVRAGDRLPQKSTHFHPKMFSGFFGVSLEDPVY